MATDLGELIDDLAAEEDDLAVVLRGLPAEQWDHPTPAAGWRVRDQVSHLADGEELATLALRDEAAFAARVGEMLADLEATARDASRRAAAPAEDVLGRWETTRAETLAGLRGRLAGDRVPWVTGPMACASFTTARLMETWAHGQDIADGLAVERVPTARLRHVAHLGVATRTFSFANRGLVAPAADVRVELEAPDGTTWIWGPADATERVTGPAVDFCLVVTQRRNVADSALRAAGDGAATWLAIAQCFAGPPTEAPPPRRSA